MDDLYINGPAALSDATSLIEQFGQYAESEAANRARRSRDDGNVARFCHWRQIERVIAALSCDDILGSIH